MKNKILIFGLASLLLFTSCFAGIKTYAQNTSTLSSNSSCSLENLSNCNKDGLIMLLIQLILQKISNTGTTLPTPSQTSELVLSNINCDDYNVTVEYCNTGNRKEDDLFSITLKNEKTGQKVTSASFLNIPQSGTCNYWTVLYNAIGLSYGEEAVLTAEIEWENKAITKKDAHKLERVVNVPSVFTPSQTSELVLSNINCDDYNVTVEYCNTGNIKEDDLFSITLKNEKTGQKVTSASFLNIPQSGTCNYWTVLYNAIGLSYGEEAVLTAEIEWENKAITKKDAHKLERVVNVPVSPTSPGLSNLVLHSIDPDGYSIRVRYCNNGNYKEDELFLITLKNEQTGQKVTSASFFNIPQPGTCNYWTVHQGTIGLSYGEEATLSAEIEWENKAITKKDTHKLEKVVSVP